MGKIIYLYQKVETARHIKSTIGEFPKPSERFRVVHIGLISLLAITIKWQHQLFNLHLQIH